MSGSQHRWRTGRWASDESADACSGRGRFGAFAWRHHAPYAERESGAALAPSLSLAATQLDTGTSIASGAPIMLPGHLEARSHAHAFQDRHPGVSNDSADREQRLEPARPEANRGVRVALSALSGFAALNAVGGAWYGLSGAPSVPIEWLRDTPFRSYFVPSLVLLLVVGGACATASVAAARHWRRWPLLGMGAGAILFAWTMIEVDMIGYVSWLQPTTGAAAVLILWFAARAAASLRDHS